jgi:hypothetical protein
MLGKRSKILICFKYFAASLWSVMTLGMANKSEKKEEEYQETLLANQSLLFLLVLTNHCTTEFQPLLSHYFVKQIIGLQFIVKNQ